MELPTVMSAGRPVRGNRASRRWIVVGSLIVLVVAASVLARVLASGAGWRSWLPELRGRGPDAAQPVARVIPEGTRVKVEVFNATDTRGLARAAAGVLRDAGFDVVFFGNTAERQDSTLVRDRSNHTEWAKLAARTMAPAVTEVRPDSGRLVDLTVLVGKNWRAPKEPFRP